MGGWEEEESEAADDDTAQLLQSGLEQDRDGPPQKSPMQQ